MRTKQLLVGLFTMALLVGACANSTSTMPAPSRDPSSAAASGAPATPTSVASSGPSSTTATAGAPGSTAPAPTAPTATGSDAPSACTPEAPTTLSSDWTRLQAHDGDFSFAFPATWDKLYGAYVFTTSQLVDGVTFAETGLPGGAQTRADLVRLPGNGLPNASVLIVPGVVSPLSTIFARQLDRFKTIPDIRPVASNLAACLGGELAMGVSFTFSKDTTYQESWYVSHAGRLYDFQWLAPKGQEQTDTFHEMFRTWQWTPNLPVATPLPSTSALPTVTPTAVAPTPVAPTAAPSVSAGPSSFVVAGMATRVDTTATAANPRDFLTVIPKETTVLYAVFTLKPKVSGQVDGALKQGDKVLVSLSLQYGPKNTWGDFRINSANGITPGAYTMAITLTATGETISLPFTVK